MLTMDCLALEVVIMMMLIAMGAFITYYYE